MKKISFVFLSLKWWTLLGALSLAMVVACPVTVVAQEDYTLNIFDEPDDVPIGDQSDAPPCFTCTNSCPPGSGGPSTSNPSCSSCRGGWGRGMAGGVQESGMPVWWISEPRINLRMEDEPLGYQPAHGKRLSFQLSYRQRGNVDQDSSTIFGVGSNWTCSIREYVVDFTNGETGAVAELHKGGAGWVDYVPGVPQKRDSSLMTALSGGGFQIEYSDGAIDVFTNLISITKYSSFYADYPDYGYPDGYYPYPFYFLSAQIDPVGNATTFNYSSNGGSIVLNTIVDADGNVTHLYYDNANFPLQITRVVDPFNRTAQLQYDGNGYLTNVVDVAGMGTSFGYDTGNANGSGWITNMVTPYGPTGFRYDGTDLAESPGAPSWNNVVNRLIEISESNGSHQLYLFRMACQQLSDMDSTTLMSDSYPPSVVPNMYGLPNNIYNANKSYYNSFHWDRMQYDALSTNYQFSGNWRDLTVNDYSLARLRHWMSDPSSTYDGNASYTVSQVMDLEREPSPNGITAGQVTWYSYSGTYFGWTGLSAMPCCVSRVLPDGTTWLTYTDRNQFGQTTNQIDTYSLPDGTVGLRTNTFIYATNGIDLIAHYGPSGEQVVSNVFNAFHQVTDSYNAYNDHTAYKYDSATHLLTNMVTPTGLTNIYTYDPSTLRLTNLVALPIRSTNSYTYANGLVQTQTDPRGLTTTNTWDALQRLTSIAYPDGTTVSNVYTNLDLMGAKDRLNKWTWYAYNSVRQKTFETNANNVVTGYGYCDCGALAFVTNAVGRPEQEVTWYFYDYQGNRTFTLFPDQTSFVTNNYDALGRLINMTDSAGMSVLYLYNDQGLLRESFNPEGMTLLRTYDVNDRVTNNVDQNGVVTRPTYDLLGRMLTRTGPYGTEKFGYSAAGLIAYTNQLTNVTWYGYDAARRKTAETNANNKTIFYGYNPAGDLTSLTDGNTNVTQWGYDLYGRVTNKVDATGATILTYQYDANGRLITRWSAAKGNTGYGYDNVGNLNVAHYYSSGVTLRYAYDSLNHLTNMVDPVGITTFTYDSMGQLATEGGLWSNDTITNTYANRMLSSLSFAATRQGGGKTSFAINYGYDDADRLQTISSPAGATMYEYYWYGTPLVRMLILGNGASVTNGFDSAARLTNTVLVSSANGILASENYGYDAANERTNCVRQGDATNSVAYGYDPLGQLTADVAREIGGTSRLNEQLAYVYDAAGNLQYRTNNTLTQYFGVNKLNELTQATNAGKLTVIGSSSAKASSVTVNGTNAILYADTAFAATNMSATNSYSALAQDASGHQATASVNVNLPASASYVYDANGNLLSDGLRVFTYDCENQLTSVSSGGGISQRTSQFFYDGKMRRRIRRDIFWQNGGWATNETRYIYSGNLVVQERDANNVTLTTYVRGHDLSGSFEGAGGIGGLLARVDATSTNYYHSDGNGNVTAMIDGNQTVVARYQYDAFGNVLSKSGPFADTNLYRFSSKEWDQNSGLYYYLYRYYDPNLQRWVNRDPIGEKGGANLYGFVANQPTRFSDRWGLMANSGWGGLPYSPSAGPGLPSKGNCWRYACDNPQGPNDPPWPSPSHQLPPPGWNNSQKPGCKDPCQALMDGILAAGAQPLNPYGGCYSGYHEVNVQYGPNVGGPPDFHFSKFRPDGTWWDKPGTMAPRPTPYPPSGAAPGYKSCGRLCVPDGFTAHDSY